MKIKQLIVIAILLFAGTSWSQAQIKVAHINSSELMDQLPKVDSIKSQLTKLSEQYQKTLDAIEAELTNKQQYWAQFPSKDPEVIELRQKEYQDLVNRYQLKEQEANQKIAEKQEQLLTPVLEEVKETIQKIAKEKGYNYVLDSSEGSGVIFSDPKHDLMEAVKAALISQ
ncbi:MAG: OmpH family outer membrane protein [Bacteroidetes bacterium]|nr:OmpH family outer membrane protein [Bacteroidota bacterium]